MFSKNSPMIDVLIPVYNRAEFVVPALESIVNQTYKDFRIIIYDDGSNDNTRLEISKYLSSFSGLNWALREGVVNKGVAYARNRLLDLSTSEFCMWQDSDDISHPQRLEIMLQAIQNNRCDMVFSAMYFFNHPKAHSRTKTIRSIDVSKYIDRSGLYDNTNFATGIFKRKFVKFHFDESLKRKEDIDWLTRIIKAKALFGYVDEPLYYCRRHEGRLTYAGK